MDELQIKTKVIGVDITLEYTTCAVVDIRGTIIGKERFATSDYPNVNNYVTVLCEKIVTLAENNGGYESIRSVGISAPSSNFKTGCIENAANLPWKGVVPLAAMLRDRLGMAVALGNDAHVSALGEFTYGSAHGMQNFIVMTFNQDGVGSCIFANGVPHLGIDGFAGEVGHTCVEEDGRLCGCGKRGCLERYVSATGMVQTAKELMAASDEPSLMRSIDQLNLQSIALCCRQGDKLALETIHRTAEVLGVSLANYASILNPEAIILSGDVKLVAEWLIGRTREVLDANVFHNLKGKVRLLTSIVDAEERTILGASALAWGVKEYSLFK